MNQFVTVKHATFPKLPNLPAITGYGITRTGKDRKGRKTQFWAFYLYEREEDAQRFADGIIDQQKAEVNVSQDRPYKFITGER